MSIHRTTLGAGIVLAVLMAIISYVGPARAGSVNLTAEICATHEGCYR